MWGLTGAWAHIYGDDLFEWLWKNPLIYWKRSVLELHFLNEFFFYFTSCTETALPAGVCVSESVDCDYCPAAPQQQQQA